MPLAQHRESPTLPISQPLSPQPRVPGQGAALSMHRKKRVMHLRDGLTAPQTTSRDARTAQQSPEAALGTEDALRDAHRHLPHAGTPVGTVSSPRRKTRQ